LPLGAAIDSFGTEGAMHGLMMDVPLLISALIRHADREHGDTEIVTRTIEGPIHRYTYRDAHRRSRQLASALTAMGVEPGDRVATLAWNSHRHFELFYAISGMGAVCHTVNPRLFPEQIAYILGHAEDGYVFLDLTFVGLLEKIAASLPGVRGFVIMTDRAHMPATALPNAACYEDLINAASDEFEWPEFDERTASSLCYTSGTTGFPKGVLYSHRSTVLHSYGYALPDSGNLSASDVMLLATPMFHVNGWGVPYSCAMTGAKLVLPGCALDGASLYQLFEQEEVTATVGVPTLWVTVLEYFKRNGLKPSSLRRVLIGGSACPPALIHAFEEDFGVQVLHGWGMTETSPLGTCSAFKRKHDLLPQAGRRALKAKQGRLVFGVDMKIVDDAGGELPRDGQAYGHLRVKGPWICRQYFKDEGDGALHDGWFATGDIATIDAEGYLQITDRSKDIIKSGGEWISSILLESAAMDHPGVAEAAVIGVPHPKWLERPLLLVIRRSGTQATGEQIQCFLADRVAKWWLPDDIIFVDSLPRTATGKLLKVKLREEYRDYLILREDRPEGARGMDSGA
jgi:3-(methylthio)propionyl---CoA ligase